LKIKGIYFLYRSLQAFGLPLVLLYFLWRGLRSRAYWGSLAQRFGFVPRSFQQTGAGAIWLHAVSVGEVLALIEFLKALRRQLPRTSFFVSTSTLAGRKVAAEKLASLTEGVFYAPVDYVWAVRRVLRTLQPSLVIIAETEIWPNVFREVKRTGAGLAMVNARISDRAFPRYRAWSWLFRAVLPAADSILAQTDSMRERFIALGAPPDRVRTAGNLKHDFEARAARADSPVVSFLKRLGPEQIWIAASTMPGAFPGDVDEDDAVIAAFRILAARYPGLLLLLAPRKPEQFDRAARKLEAAGIGFARRSLLAQSPVPPGEAGRPAALLLDSIGELGSLFFAADVVFLGGTLASRGGHNILEPALFAKPVITGPHMENFQAIADEFRGAQAMVEIREESELAAAVDHLLTDAAVRRKVGLRAQACAESRRGTVKRTLAVARELYETHLPQFRAAQPWFALGRPLEQLWIWSAGRRIRACARRLPIPVISIGNVTMGGTGKTPCVLQLAARLRADGWKPGVLTRGYGRTSPEKRLILAADACASSRRTGDEPQLFLRSRLAWVGIGADRWETGRLMCREFAIDVALLDDGFQHGRLVRDLDVVLIDALNPFGGGRVFPLGRLREPLAGLARAGILVITRADLTDLAAPIEHQLRLRNPEAPIFRARVEPRAWVEARTGLRHAFTERPFEQAAAFCGLGNPESFRRMLEACGVRTVDWLAFEDHHRYRPLELRHVRAQALAKGATALITTAKDAVNLHEGWEEQVAPLPLYWLEVELLIEEERLFWDEIRKHLAKVPRSPAC
jgi:3-deoxy-D-manno-octulosonic-acid transferase